jgi:Fe-S oxidoreductase
MCKTFKWGQIIKLFTIGNVQWILFFGKQLCGSPYHHLNLFDMTKEIAMNKAHIWQN